MTYTKEQIEAQQDFLESKCDMFTSADFQYYAESTGKGIEWIMANAKFDDSEGMYGNCLSNAIIDNDSNLAEFLI